MMGFQHARKNWVAKLMSMNTENKYCAPNLSLEMSFEF